MKSLDRGLPALALVIGLISSQTGLAQGQVEITAPKEGATLDAMAENRVVYKVDPGPKGDHVHVYVDDKEVGIVRQLQGGYALGALESGNRNICIKVVNKAHTPIGIEECVRVTVN